MTRSNRRKKQRLEGIEKRKMDVLYEEARYLEKQQMLPLDHSTKQKPKHFQSLSFLNFLSKPLSFFILPTSLGF